MENEGIILIGLFKTVKADKIFIERRQPVVGSLDPSVWIAD